MRFFCLKKWHVCKYTIQCIMLFSLLLNIKANLIFILLHIHITNISLVCFIFILQILACAASDLSRVCSRVKVRMENKMMTRRLKWRIQARVQKNKERKNLKANECLKSSIPQNTDNSWANYNLEYNDSKRCHMKFTSHSSNTNLVHCALIGKTQNLPNHQKHDWVKLVYWLSVQCVQHVALYMLKLGELSPDMI